MTLDPLVGPRARRPDVAEATPGQPATGVTPAETIGTALRDDLERIVRLSPSVQGEGTLIRQSAKLHYVLRGPAGAAHFELQLQWYRGDLAMALRTDYPPRGVDLSLHSPTPRWTVGGRAGCTWIEGACWSRRLKADEAEDLGERTLYRGDGVIWQRLEELYARELA